MQVYYKLATDKWPRPKPCKASEKNPAAMWLLNLGVETQQDRRGGALARTKGWCFTSKNWFSFELFSLFSTLLATFTSNTGAEKYLIGLGVCLTAIETSGLNGRPSVRDKTPACT